MMKGVYFILMAVVLVSCANDEQVSLKAKDPGIFAHYDIRADEETGMATCLIRFYTDKSRKTALVLEEPSKVELDGEMIIADSSRFSGAYYEVRKPVAEFEGQHTITFTNFNNQKNEEVFSFTPLIVNTPLTGPVSKNSLMLELEGLQSEDLVRVVMIDTSFHSDGINQLKKVNDGQLHIGEDLLRKLQSGPIVLEISKESERPLVSGLKGIFTSTYTIRRDLFLKDE